MQQRGPQPPPPRGGAALLCMLPTMCVCQGAAKRPGLPFPDAPCRLAARRAARCGHAAARRLASGAACRALASAGAPRGAASDAARTPAPVSPAVRSRRAKMVTPLVKHKIVKKRLKPFLRNQSDLKLAMGVRHSCPSDRGPALVFRGLGFGAREAARRCLAPRASLRRACGRARWRVYCGRAWHGVPSLRLSSGLGAATHPAPHGARQRLPLHACLPLPLGAGGAATLIMSRRRRCHLTGAPSPPSPPTPDAHTHLHLRRRAGGARRALTPAAAASSRAPRSCQTSATARTRRRSTCCPAAF